MPGSDDSWNRSRAQLRPEWIDAHSPKLERSWLPDAVRRLPESNKTNPTYLPDGKRTPLSEGTASGQGFNSSGNGIHVVLFRLVSLIYQIHCSHQILPANSFERKQPFAAFKWLQVLK